MVAKKLTLVCGFVVAGLAGCGHSPKEAPQAAAAAHEEAAHSGWWCNEHGVPEEVCALCDTKLVASFKAKGDWCADHDRPDSQCFACHPEKEGEFAAAYEAKYGSKPPKPSDNPSPAAGETRS